MKNVKSLQCAQDGYQPIKNEFQRGYQPTQQVKPSNLTIPKNLGSAGVTPQSAGQAESSSNEVKK